MWIYRFLPWWSASVIHALSHSLSNVCICILQPGCNIIGRSVCVFFLRFAFSLMFPLVKLTMKLSPAPASVQRRNQCVIIMYWSLVQQTHRLSHMEKVEPRITTTTTRTLDANVIKSDKQIKTNNIVANNVVLSLFVSLPWPRFYASQ